MTQTVTSYLYDNKVDVLINNDITNNLRNRVVYSRTLKIYKGIDNTVKLQFKNTDQIPVNMTGYAVQFNIINEETGSTWLSVDGTVLNGNTGIVSATIKDVDIIDLPDEWYNYSVSVIDPQGTPQLSYSSDNWTVRGDLQILGGNYPQFIPSLLVQIPTNTSNATITSQSISSDPSLQGRNSLHTAQFYFDPNGFTGNIEVQATLSPIPTQNGPNIANATPIVWAHVTTLDYTSQTSPDFVNWQGAYTAIRFAITRFVGNVTQILYRN